MTFDSQFAGIAGASLRGECHGFAGAATDWNYSGLTIAGLSSLHATAPDSTLSIAAVRVSTRLFDGLDGKSARTGTVMPIKGQGTI